MAPLALHFGGYQPPTSVHTRAAEVFGQTVTDRLGADIRFHLDGNVIASGHNATDLLTMVESGALTLCYFSASYLAARVAAFALLDLPFLLNDRRTAYALLDGPFGDALTESLQASTGLQLLGFWDNGFRHLSNAVRPIRTPADCAGLRLRTLLSDMHRQVFQALGFIPVPLDVKDLLPAVQAGTVEAQENPLTTIYHFGLHAYHRYITLTSHFFGVAVLLCHQQSYRTWPAAIRQAVTEAAVEATAAQRRFAAAEDDEVLARLDPAQNEVIRLTESERAVFVNAVAPLVQAQRQTFGEHLWQYVMAP